MSCVRVRQLNNEELNIAFNSAYKIVACIAAANLFR